MKKAAEARCFSGIGRRHIKQNIDNQDCTAAEENSLFTAAVLADGVSSVRFGGEGAKTACEELRRCMLEYGAFFMECEESKLPDFILGQVRYALSGAAGQLPLREFASTLAGFLADNRSGRLLYYSLGDSLGLYTRGDTCWVLDAPEDSTEGCHATVSEDAQRYMRVGKLEPEEYDSAVFFSDGAWRLIYNGTGLRSEVRELLLRQDYNALETFLTACGGEDDYSFSAIIRRPAGRKGHVK